MLENLGNIDFSTAKPSHIYDELDPQMVQENEDDDDEGIIDDPEFAARDPGGFNEPGQCLSPNNTFKTQNVPSQGPFACLELWHEKWPIHRKNLLCVMVSLIP